MSAHNYHTPDPAGNDDEPAGAERYLHPGENLRICSSDIQIKKFRFESYLTNKRLFFIDQNDTSGITAKEIPVQSIQSSYLEESPAREPVLVLSIRTSDDDIRTMKMAFMHTGEDRSREAEEWVHLILQAASAAIPGRRPQDPEPSSAPEARALTDTMIVPASRTPPPAAGPLRAQPPGKPEPDRTHGSVTAGAPLSAVTRIVYCFHCGKKLPELANFCPFCGTRVHENSHDAASHLPPSPPKNQEPPAKPPLETVKKTGWRRFFGR